MAFSRPELDEELFNLEENLDKAVSHLKNQLLSIRAGRANPQILGRVIVDYYGTMTPLTQMANISVPDPRMLLITLYDNSMLKNVVKAIAAADLGVNPTDDGKVIRLVFPQLTEERRKDLCKQVRKSGEDSKVVLRGERRDSMDRLKKLKKDLSISEDEIAIAEKEVQKLIDKYTETADKIIKSKEAEIIEI